MTQPRRTVLVAIVSYSSSEQLRGCVEPLVALPGITVVVADNNPGDGSADAVADLAVDILPSPLNGGFAYGCNRAARHRSSDYVLLLNPDARIDGDGIDRLVDCMTRDPSVGLAAPRVLEEDGRTAPSIRRFPGIVSTFAQALFLHRVAPRAPWVDELVRDQHVYARERSCDWVSGACMMIGRHVWDRLGGLDERFFLYCEDTDVCRRIRDLGLDVRYVPDAIAQHRGGASAPRGGLLGVLAESRLTYARLHRTRAAAALERAGIAVGAALRLALGRERGGNADALRAALGVGPPPSEAYRGRWPPTARRC